MARLCRISTRSGEQPADDFPQLSGTGAAGGRQDVVFNHTREARQIDPDAEGSGGVSELAGRGLHERARDDSNVFY